VYPIPGHLACSVLGVRLFKAEWTPVVIGAFLPDLIDKPLNDVLHWTPYGRCFMHSWLGLGLCFMAAYYFWGKTTALSYGFGHLAHLIADMDFNPWFWPFVRYDWPPGIDILDIPTHFWSIFRPFPIFLEALLLASAAFLFTRWGQKRYAQAAAATLFVLISAYRIYWAFQNGHNHAY